MKRLLFLIPVAAIAAYTMPTRSSAALPDLPDTRLYRELAHNCHPVDLTRWNHPTKRVLEKYHVKLDALELCNSDTYPIFHVHFRYDPRTNAADSFFIPFYHDMFGANSRNPMAFVDGADDEIVMIGNDHGVPLTDVEQYKNG